MALENPFVDQNPIFTYYKSSKREPLITSYEDSLWGKINLNEKFGENMFRINPHTGNYIAKANTPEAEESQMDYQNKMAESDYRPSAETTTYNAKQDLKGNQKKAMKFFQSKGLSAHHAAGIVGNLMGESNLNHTAVNKSSGAYGIAQWLGNRKKKLFSKYGNNPTFEQQLEFVWEELNSDEKPAYNRLLQTKSVDEAINSFMQHFERPSKREMAQSISTRLKYGRGLLS